MSEERRSLEFVLKKKQKVKAEEWRVPVPVETKDQRSHALKCP